MEVTIQKIDEPKPANPERGYSEGKYYHVWTTSGQKLLLNKEKYDNFVKEKGLKQGATGTVLTGESNGYIYLNQFIPTNQNVVNAIPSPQPTPTAAPTPPQATQNSYQPTTEGTAGGHDVADIQSKDWAIILQSLINRNQTISPTNKLKWFLTLYSYGAKEAFERLKKNKLTEEQILDLDNTAISEMPDDKIPF